VNSLDLTERGESGFGSAGIATVPSASGVISSESNADKQAKHFIDYGVPAMPLRSKAHTHRPKEAVVYAYSACVARSVTKKEARQNAKAMAALDKEWKKLIDQGCWDNSTVEEWHVVAARARKKDEKVHIGRIFDICVEKNSELDENDPNRKFKGRVVFEGCHVKDESNNWAIFAEISSCPATMEAGKAADAYGMFDNHDVQLADGESAYTQAKLKGTVACVRLPQERWPKEWIGKYRDPVVKLVLALYGHPDAGGFWEKHCEAALNSIGFEKIEPWSSVFFHEELRLMLVLYVDDFKMAGPKKKP
jgi:hypothetical protein